jgi:hypothetical protein
MFEFGHGNPGKGWRPDIGNCGIKVKQATLAAFFVATCNIIAQKALQLS